MSPSVSVRNVYRIVDGDTERWFIPSIVGVLHLHGIELTPENRVAPVARRVKYPLELFGDGAMPAGWELVEVEGP